MSKKLLITSTVVLSFMLSVGFIGPLFAQNQTNTTTSTQNQTGGGQQQNQTGIGTASEIENLTAGNTALLQNTSDIGSQNTSVTGGLEQEQEATETSNLTSQQQNQTGGGQENQTEGGNETQQGPLEQLGETLGGIFGGGNQSQ